MTWLSWRGRARLGAAGRGVAVAARHGGACPGGAVVAGLGLARRGQAVYYCAASWVVWIARRTRDGLHFNATDNAITVARLGSLTRPARRSASARSDSPHRSAISARVAGRSLSNSVSRVSAIGAL
jgi:hypothetical protein